jgi:hypothetical protein
MLNTGFRIRHAELCPVVRELAAASSLPRRPVRCWRKSFRPAVFCTSARWPGAVKGGPVDEALFESAFATCAISADADYLGQVPASLAAVIRVVQQSGGASEPYKQALAYYRGIVERLRADDRSEILVRAFPEQYRHAGASKLGRQAPVTASRQNPPRDGRSRRAMRARQPMASGRLRPWQAVCLPASTQSSCRILTGSRLGSSPKNSPVRMSRDSA